MVTIKDVARQAGVSVTSASYALNGTGTISESTRQRVKDAAEALNYHPNAFARSLITHKTHTIGVFITRFSGSFYEDILEGIHDAVLKTDYELLVCPESRPPHKILTRRQVDGAIVFDSKISSSVLVRLADSTFPVIVLDRDPGGDFIFPLLLDNCQGVREAFYHLYDQGYRRLAFVSGAEDSFDNTERRQTFLEEAEKNGLPVACYPGNFTEESGYQAALPLIQSHSLPEAVFCANDQMAIGFIKALQANGLRVPEDVAVVGFDDIQISRYIQPSLSTVGASRVLWGSTAVTGLIDYLEHGTPFRSERIPAHLIARESSIRPSSPDAARD